ncbi:hypothetical protein [Aquimarina macrocephali]|uniref:hypothetical protein n=1 Tax=Aquimarina macrocephali TaxID=666563 RepID=UPI003F6626AF
MNKIDSIKNKEAKKTNYFVIISSLLAVISILAVLLLNLTFITKKPEIRGTFGDMFGFSNAIFSGLAFAGIIITIILQKNELTLQREELKETRDELSRSAQAHEKMEIQQRKQSENLRITAEINALNALLNFSLEIYKDDNRNSVKENAMTRMKSYRSKLEKILEKTQV